MKLERFGTRLDDYLTGELDAASRREIEDFLASSPDARRELEEYRAMVTALGKLPDSMEPERDLFPGIEDRLGWASERRPHRRVWLLAATLVAALGLAYLTTLWREAPATPVIAAGETAAETALANNRATGAATARAERDLRDATDRLKLTLEEHRTALPPETLRLVGRNLEIIQGAIDEIQQAIDQDPSNQELNRALVAYRQHELALLEQVNRAASRL